MTKVGRKLTRKQQYFAAGVASGLTLADSYRRAYHCANMAPATIRDEASRLMHHPGIAELVAEILREARIEDLDSAQRAFADLLRDIEAARQAENWTVVAALSRMRLTYHGLLKDRLLISHEERMTDAELVEKLSGGDERRAALAWELLGAPDDFDDQTRH